MCIRDRYNIGKGDLSQYYVKPNLQVVNPATSQDVTRLASSPLDKHSTHPELEALKRSGKLTWRDVVTAQTLINHNSRERIAERLGIKPSELNVSNVKWAEVLKETKQSNPFLYKTLSEGNFNYFSGGSRQSDIELAQALRSKGVNVNVLKSFNVAMDDVLSLIHI